MKWLTAVAALALVSLAGCATVQNTGTLAVPTWNYRVATPSSFSLSVLPDSLVDGATADGFSLSAKDVGGNQVLVDINVDNAAGLKALYFNLDMTPLRFVR